MDALSRPLAQPATYAADLVKELLPGAFHRRCQPSAQTIANSSRTIAKNAANIARHVVAFV